MKTEKIIFIDYVHTSDAYMNFEIKNFLVHKNGNAGSLLTDITKERKYTPAPKDKLWIYPYSNIPRFKMKQFCENYKTAMVKDEDKATAKFVGPDYFHKITNVESYCNVLDKERFIEYLKRSEDKSKVLFYQIVSSEGKKESPLYIKEFIKLLEELPMDKVYFSHYELKDLEYNEAKGKGYDHLFSKNYLVTEEEMDKMEDEYVLTCAKSEEFEADFDDILTNPAIYHQDELLSKLSGAVMTEDMYHRVHDMLISSDKESQKLAMEAIASCDFQKSAVYLLLLLYTNSTIIHNIPSKHHSNFKSLLKFFNLSSVNDLRSIDRIIESLKHQKLFNLTNLNILMPLAMEHIRNNGEMDNIKIKDVELSPEAELALAENILDSKVEIVDDPSESVLGEL